jgi:hypothetical protein
MPKITGLGAGSAPANSDVLVLVSNTSGTANTQKVTVNTFFSNITANVVFANTTVDKLHISNTSTPANAGPGFAEGISAGQIWSDGDFIYVATAANTIKRVAISTF